MQYYCLPGCTICDKLPNFVHLKMPQLPQLTCDYHAVRDSNSNMCLTIHTLRALIDIGRERMIYTWSHPENDLDITK